MGLEDNTLYNIICKVNWKELREGHHSEICLEVLEKANVPDYSSSLSFKIKSRLVQ